MSLQKWLSSKLYDNLGFSDTSLVEMIISYGQESSSYSELHHKLEAQGIGKQLLPFAEELYNILHPPLQLEEPFQTEKSLIDNQFENNYGKVKNKDILENEGTVTTNTKTPTSVDESPKITLHEDEREIDIRERDELDLRIREREEKKRKHPSRPHTSESHDYEVGDLSTPMDYAIAAKRGRNEKLRDNPLYMDRLRIESRRKFLEKREPERLQLKEWTIKDKEWFLGGIELTEIEKKKLEWEKSTLQAAKKALDARTRQDEIEDYHLPDSYDDNLEKRLAVLTKNLKDSRSQPLNEQQLWEKHQASSAIAKFGARKGHDKDRSTKYQLLDETGAKIDFVQLETHGGINDTPQLNTNAIDINKSRKKRDLIQQERLSLPVYHYREQLLKAIHQYPVLVVVGETGSGKTTQIPQFLYEVGYTKVGKIGCTQPRRVAAMSVATRVAEEMGVKLGREVGYSIRFEDCTSDKTVIKYMTDGMLLREFLSEPDLSSYSVILVDEAHERTLHTDVLFGLVKDLSRYKDDFKLIISSATLEAEKFSFYFDNAPIFKVPGRRFPVQIYYTKAPEANFIDASVVTVLQIHLTQPLGDILVFFPGQQEIEEAQEELERRVKGKGTEFGELIVLPIYSSLPGDLQSKIFEPTPVGARKVVLATNIAETSITIANIVYVIDPGFCKQNAYNPKTGMESLVIVPCSKASANQRAGRAGRVKPGHCFRLYTRFSFQKEMEDANVPEIQRTNLGNVVLSLKSIGIDDLINFDFMDPPPPETLIKALELLYALGALNDKGQLTKLGRRMAEFPMDPMHSKMIIQADKYQCVEECVTICAMLGVGNAIFYRPKDKGIHADNARKNFFRPGGDHLTLLNVYNQWESVGFSINWCYENFIQYRSMKRARDIHEQLSALLERVEIEESSNPNDSEAIRKAITSGFFTHGARLNKNGSYTTMKNPHSVDIHPQSSLFGQDSKMVIYTELVLTTKEYMRNVSEIKPEWLIQVAPHYYKNQQMELGGKLSKNIGIQGSKDSKKIST